MIQTGEQRTLSYFKRFKMEIDLYEPPAVPVLPAGFYWVPWDTFLLDLHADVLFGCFTDEIDANVFPSLGTRTGCGQLMTEICRKLGFLPAATWLLACAEGYCGTVLPPSRRSEKGDRTPTIKGPVPFFGTGSPCLIVANQKRLAISTVL